MIPNVSTAQAAIDAAWRNDLRITGFDLDELVWHAFFLDSIEGRSGVWVCLYVGFVFVGTAKVQNCQGNLKDDERIGMVMPAPNYPEAVAKQKAPKANLTPAFYL